MLPRGQNPGGQAARRAGRPDRARLVRGKLSGFTLLFEALVLALAQQMTFAAVARLVNESWHRVHAICSRYIDLAVAQADLSAVSAVAIDETSCQRGHDYLIIAAAAAERKIVFVTKGARPRPSPPW
jgi:hypothetical protein